MEKYFDKVSKDHYAGKKLVDAHPENAFQNGVTPELKEKAKSHCEMFKKYNDEDKPVSECPPVYDSKWRFFWYIGERDPNSEKDMLMFPNVIPEGFPKWEKIMNTWGTKMLDSTHVASKMAAVGFSLPENTFFDKMKYAGHLLAPTGSDLNKFKIGEVFAGVHYDLNFLTIHGKSNYGGLYVWLRNGQKKKVRIPDGCLLIQAGIQLEYLTGGACLAGFHEVVYTPEVYSQIEKIKLENQKRKEEDKVIPWRISSTMFTQINQNLILEPVGKYKNESTLQKYPPVLTRDQVAAELKAISLMAE